MKQPKSQTTMRNKMTKRIVFPTVRHSKQPAKLQQYESNDKSAVYFNVKLLPFDICLFRDQSSCLKVQVSASQIVIQGQNSLNAKHQLRIQQNEWIGIDFGQSYRKIRIKKFGDENVFGKNHIGWDSSSAKNQKCLLIQLNELLRRNIRTSTTEEKSKDIKSFVSTLMAKKMGRRSEQRTLPQENNTNIRRASGVLKNRLSAYNQAQLKPQFSGHRISGTSIGLSTFRKDIVNASKFTKNSQRETNISGEQSMLNPRHLQPSTLTTDSQQYMKIKSKFDTQPYFQNTGSFKGSRVDSTFNCQLSKLQHEEPHTVQLPEQTIHKSEIQESVEEQIKRSNISVSDAHFSSAKPKKEKKSDDSSSCYQSEELESGEIQINKKDDNNLGLSSGSLCESRYQ